MKKRLDHPDTTDWLACSRDAAAERLGISRTSIDRYIRAGLLKSTKARGRRLIPKAALQEFLATR